MSDASLRYFSNLVAAHNAGKPIPRVIGVPTPPKAPGRGGRD
jgi:hypothetical protein